MPAAKTVEMVNQLAGIALTSEQLQCILDTHTKVAMNIGAEKPQTEVFAIDAADSENEDQEMKDAIDADETNGNDEEVKKVKAKIAARRKEKSTSGKGGHGEAGNGVIGKKK